VKLGIDPGSQKQDSKSKITHSRQSVCSQCVGSQQVGGHVECSQVDLTRVRVFATRGHYQCEKRCSRKVCGSISIDLRQSLRNGDESQSFYTIGNECRYVRVRGEREQGSGFIG
jgi:hypothetical protein